MDFHGIWYLFLKTSISPDGFSWYLVPISEKSVKQVQVWLKY